MSRDSEWGGPERRNHIGSRRGVHFNKTIDLGHILSMLGFLVGVMVAWNQLDKRVTVLEEQRKVQESRDLNQDGQVRDRFSEIKESLIEIKGNVKALSEKLEASGKRGR